MDWIRATSPACNCNNSRRIPTRQAYSDQSADTSHESTVPVDRETVEQWPALLTCAADREDHGTTGAYTAWPALAAEALCYIEGNCSCVDPTSRVASHTLGWLLQRFHVRFIQVCVRGHGQFCAQHIPRSFWASKRRAPTTFSSLRAVQRRACFQALRPQASIRVMVLTHMSFDSFHSMLCAG